MKYEKRIFLIVLFIFTFSNLSYAKEDSKLNLLNLVPIRDLFESLDYDVLWNENNKTITVSKDENVINFIRRKNDNLNKVHNTYEFLIINGIGYTYLNNLENLNIEYGHLDLNTIYLEKRIGVGDLAPVIENSAFENKDLKLLTKDESTNEKIRILFFWATWCPYCTDYIAELNNLINNFNGDFNIEIIGVNIDNEDNLNKVKEVLNSDLKNVNNVIDPKKEIFNLYNPGVIPTTYVINEKGIIINIINGNLKESNILNY